MEDPNQDVQTDPSPVTDVNQESSPEAPVEATTQQAVPEEQRYAETNGANERIRNLLAEQKWLKEQVALANARPIVQSQPQVQDDPYRDIPESDRPFYKQMDERNRRIAQEEARKIAADERVSFQRELEQNKHVIASLAYERFQAKHPEIKPNSPEETAIAELINTGYSLDNAYKVVMFDKLQEDKAKAARAVQTQKVQSKVAANVETSSIPASSGLPQPSKYRDVREFVEAKQKSGEFVL